MPTREEMAELVAAHRDLEEPIDAAIWINRADPFAWLVEVLPDLPDDRRVAHPLVFTPSRDFPYALHLIAGNRSSLEQAIVRDRTLANQISAGEILYENGDQAKRLIELAAQATNGTR
jgi:hypothetical protein